QRRRGANHRAPVTVISGVIDTAMKKQISPPVPSMSASVFVRLSFAFSENQPRAMKIHGMNAGRRSRNSIRDCFLITRAENTMSSPIQLSTVRGFEGSSGGGFAAGSGRAAPTSILAMCRTLLLWGYSSAAATGNSLSARSVRGSGLLRILPGMLAFCRNHLRLGFYGNHFRVVMRSRRVRLARALVLLGTGLRRARPVGPEDKKGRSVQD